MQIATHARNKETMIVELREHPPPPLLKRRETCASKRSCHKLFKPTSMPASSMPASSLHIKPQQTTNSISPPERNLKSNRHRCRGHHLFEPKLNSLDKVKSNRLVPRYSITCPGCHQPREPSPANPLHTHVVPGKRLERHDRNDGDVETNSPRPD